MQEITKTQRKQIETIMDKALSKGKTAVMPGQWHLHTRTATAMPGKMGDNGEPMLPCISVNGTLVEMDGAGGIKEGGEIHRAHLKIKQHKTAGGGENLAYGIWLKNSARPGAKGPDGKAPTPKYDIEFGDGVKINAGRDGLVLYLPSTTEALMATRLHAEKRDDIPFANGVDIDAVKDAWAAQGIEM